MSYKKVTCPFCDYEFGHDGGDDPCPSCDRVIDPREIKTKTENNVTKKHKCGEKAPRDPNTILYCSFCGKAQFEVARLIAAPSVCICNECIVMSVNIIMGSEADAFAGQAKTKTKKGDQQSEG